MLLPALDMLKKALTIPSTVPRKPIIGAPPAMEARIGRPFSRRETSTLPVFSMADWMSAIGRPRRWMPVSIIRATGLSYLRHRVTADLVLPAFM